MSVELKAHRYQIEKLKEEAWQVAGIPPKRFTDEELANFLLVPLSTITRAKKGYKVSNHLVAGVMARFKNRPDLTKDLWYVDGDVQELQQAA